MRVLALQGVRGHLTVVTQQRLFSLYSPQEKALVVGVFYFYGMYVVPKYFAV